MASTCSTRRSTQIHVDLRSPVTRTREFHTRRFSHGYTCSEPWVTQTHAQPYCLPKYFGNLTNFISHAKSIYLKNISRDRGNTNKGYDIMQNFLNVTFAQEGFPSFRNAQFINQGLQNKLNALQKSYIEDTCWSPSGK